MSSPIHVLQPSFASGLISPEVANRCDLDKYKAALTVAKNCYIRPYGPVYKRGGMVYCLDANDDNAACILVPFSVSTTEDYLVEIGLGYVEEKPDNTTVTHPGYIRVIKEGKTVVKTVTVQEFMKADDFSLDNLRFTQSADVMFITSGKYPVKKLARKNTTWTFENLEFDQVYFDASLVSSVEGSEEIKVTPSATSGSNITLTADYPLFSAGMDYIQLTQNVPSVSSKKTATASNSQGAENEATTDILTVGDTWKIMTGGTWTGTVTVQYKLNDEWKELRSYQSTDNYNVTESGTFDEETDIRAIWSITSGTCTLTLSAMPYDKTGYAKIKPATISADKKTVNADVVKDFGTTSATKDYAWGVWCEEFGYPSCACFFQDRLCFAATKKQPYAVWMSRTGDYYNFEVEKAGGNVTDDSAIAVSFISRKQQKIMHLVPSVDLLVLTEGNEWLVSGSEVVTPSSITPRLQATRGCNNCEPLMIGNRMIFIQGRGSTVRDMGYTYESDSYVGQDLTILAQDLVRGKNIVDITYKQEPNSMVYCVRDDGSVICLSYIREQDVYAWSKVETYKHKNAQGEIDREDKVEAVCCVGEGSEDKVYAVVNRNGKRYIEAFSNDVYSDDVQDYVMLDSAVKINLGVNDDEEKILSNTFTVEHFKGQTVDVLADGRVHKNITVNSSGVLTIPANVNDVVVGLPYSMELELPNVEIQLSDGSMQGRKKTITRCMLRLRKSLGGMVGADFDRMDEIKYDEISATENIQVFSGDKQATVPMGGYDFYGKLAIKSTDPYPFMLMCAVRVITFGG